MDLKKIKIGYSGTLGSYDGEIDNSIFFRHVKNYFFTYRNTNLNFSTRSGYYLFLALAAFKKKYPDAVKYISVNLWGIIDGRNKKQIKELQLEEMVTIEGYFSKEESQNKLKQCDLFFFPLESSKGNQKPLFIPGKLFEYLQFGKPILVLAEESDCTEILNKSQMGIILNPQESEKIADTLFSFISQPALLENFRANKDYINQFSFENISRKLSEIFNDVLSANI